MAMNPVSKTAYYCCGVRMADAERRRPVCGDNYAKRFMDEEARAFFAQFKSEKRALRGNAARHRIIDDLLRAAIGEAPGLTVYTIGAGFDTRPYRMHAGIFVELDAPALIALKNERLPVRECKNKLTRIAIDFASERLADKLGPLKSDTPCMFVIEGVFMYLEQSAIAETLHTLSALFANHTLICDLMRRSFLDKYASSLRDRLEALGAQLRVVDDPYPVFTAQHYRLLQKTSITGAGLQLDLPGVLRPLARRLPADLRDGYEVAVFSARAS
jgi:methyltransferase (TIGR00027 family)